MNQRLILLLALLVAVSGSIPALRATDTEARVVNGQAFSFTEIRPDIWHVRGTGLLPVGSNGALIVGQREVILVDSKMTPAAAQALVEELVLVTDQPIRYVINTHFHFDHVQGNQVFGPEVEIVAHEWTHKKMAGGGTRTGRAYDYFIGSLPSRIESAEGELGDLAEGEERSALESRLERMRMLWSQDQETDLVAPTLTIRDQMSLFRDQREIRIFFLGKGHTGGDLAVYLPRERVLISGDLVGPRLPYMGDGYPDQWAETLDAIGELDIEVIVPGHGAAFEEIDRIGHLRDYLKDLWRQVEKLHASGAKPEDAAERVDLTSHADSYPQIEGPGAPRAAIDRIYALLDGTEQ